jgi:hypothetical protein
LGDDIICLPHGRAVRRRGIRNVLQKRLEEDIPEFYNKSPSHCLWQILFIFVKISYYNYYLSTDFVPVEFVEYIFVNAALQTTLCKQWVSRPMFQPVSEPDGSLVSTSNRYYLIILHYTKGLT